MASGKKNYELEILISGGTDASLAASVNRARNELRKLERAAGISADGMLDGIDVLGRQTDKVFSGILKGAKWAAGGVAGIAGASTMVGIGFESQMSTVQAISQASDGEMASLRALAKEMGETTQFSAEEAGKGLEYMASAGWSTKQMMDGLPGVMHLAAASGEDLALSSDIVTGALTAFGKGADEAARFADVLAQAAASSNTDVAGLGGAFEYVAPVAGALKYSYEDVAVAVGLMSNANIKGEKAGTAMRAMLSNLAKPTKQTQEYMDKLNLSMTNQYGQMLSLNDLLGDIRDGFSGLTEAQKAEYAAGIAGKEGMSGLLAIVNASETDVAKLTEDINNCTGAAERMANIRLDNLKGDLTLLQSAAQGTGIELYGLFSEDLREIVRDGSAWLTDLTEQVRENAPTIQRHMNHLGTQLQNGLEPIMDFGDWCVKHPDAVQGTLAGIATALATFKTVQVAKGGIAMFSKLSGLIGAWPVALAGLAVGGIVGIGTAIQTMNREAARANLAEHFGEITLSIEDLDEAARHIIGGGGTLFGQLDGFYEASQETEALRKSLESGLEDIQAANWKLNLGIVFDEQDTQSYVSAVSTYIKEAQDYITSSGYEMKLAVGLVFGEGEQGEAAASDNDAFYQSLYQQLQPLEQSLEAVMQNITENGLTLDKQKVVDGYLADISEITSMITEAERSAKMQFIEAQYTGANLLSGDTFQNLQESINQYTDEAGAGLDESYQKILTSLNAQRLAGEKGQEGGITQEEFDIKSNEALKSYYNQKAQIIQNGYQIMKDTVMSTYGDEITPALAAIEQQIQEGLPAVMENHSTPESFAAAFGRLVQDSVAAAKMSSSSRDAVKLLLEGMMPAQEELEQLGRQMTASGFSPSAIITDVLSGMDSLQAATGDELGIWKLIGDSVADNEDYALLTATVYEQTGQIPVEVIEALTSKNDEILAEAQNILNIMKDTFSGGVEANIPITLNTITRYRSGELTEGIKAAHNAKGGLIQRPTLSWFAEESPEMAIPLNGSRRSVDLWRKTGELLGAYNENNYGRMYGELVGGMAVQSSSSSSFAPVFSPVIQISSETGNAREQVLKGVTEGYERFVEYMERYNREQYRVAF